MDAAARQRTYDIPKSDSAGLTEWTSKIKALQRQVDEDEEAETRRLEEEIMASRMSRMRRSTLQPRPSGHDPCEPSAECNNHPEIHITHPDAEAAAKLPRVASPVSEIDHIQPSKDKQLDREATMRKLMGQRSPIAFDLPSKTSSENPSPTPPKPSSSANKPRQDPMSLAAFMGSRETGPRMNKHAPQQDVHDPTQFEQRWSITSPHPVFGKNGVAMPGLVPKSPGPQLRASPRSADVEVASPIRSTPLNLRERKISTPVVAQRYVEKIESESPSKPSPSPILRDAREYTRKRTMSTPSGPGVDLQRYATPPKQLLSSVEPTFANKQSPPLPQAHNNLYTSSTPNLHRHSYTPRPISNEAKPDPPRKTFPPILQPGRTETEPPSGSRSTTLPVATSSFRRSPSPSTTSTILSRPAKTVTTLARPVEPKPNPLKHGPKGVSFDRSPAFSDRTPPKGVTPSLSRLQGRGFVQNMVKASAELGSPTGASPALPERTRSESQKKTSVLDRWPGTGSAVSTPMISLASVSMRKAKTFDPVNDPASGLPGLHQPSLAPKPVSIPKRKSQTFEKGSGVATPLSKSPSKGILFTPKEKEKPLPTTTPTTSNGHAPGIGSSNTLVSYIKPMKTGDSEPSSPVRSKTPTATDGASELGIRKRKSSGKLREKSVSFATSPPRSKTKSVVDVLPSPGKPLSHPTKGRAKKPKRAKIATAIVRDDRQQVHVSRTEILLNTANHDLPISGVSSRSALPTPPPPKHSPTSRDLPLPPPTMLTPSSSSGPQNFSPVPIRSSKSRSPSPQLLALSLGHTIPPKGRSPPSTQPKVVDRWANGPIIGVKPVSNGKAHTSSCSTSPPPTLNRGSFGRVALPGLSMAPRDAGGEDDRAPLSPASAKEPPEEKPQERNSGERKYSVDKPRRPPVPHKPSRIPSTGNRATVMDVAQVWSQHEKEGSQDVASPRSASPNSPLESGSARPVGIQAGPGHQREREREKFEREGPPKVDVKVNIAGWGIQSSCLSPSTVDAPKESELDNASLKLPEVPSPTEKRKSSWVKYSEFIMPALEEEWTPAPTPMPTMKGFLVVAAETEVPTSAPISEAKRFGQSGVDYLRIDLLSTTLDPEKGVTKVAPTDLVTFGFPSYVVPKVDIRPLLESVPEPAPADPGVTTVSVDVLSIVGSASSAINSETNIFYDTEILAIIWRAKVKSSGLVDTKVWGWIGRDATVHLKEGKALADLAKRYGTKLVSVKQYHEPIDMVTILGGTLAVRQGTRAHWSCENTAMHLVRSTKGAMFIDEQHLSVQSLCSGFSYCLSILQMFYVWNGQGARPEEKKAALDYAASLCGDVNSVIVLDEGDNDEDEIFWAVLGDGDREYAKASHWVWRASVGEDDPQIWKISALPSQQFTHIHVISNPSLNDGVFILDTAWEVCILVGAEARGRREDILLAIATATALVSSVGPSRPFVPPIHVLVFPSQVPRDLRLAVRGLSLDPPDGDEAVEHMNILSASQALDHLNASKWHKAALGDKTLLPLGLSPKDLN